MKNYKGDVSSDDDNDSDGNGSTAILLTPATGPTKARKISTAARRSQGAAQASAQAEQAALPKVQPVSSAQAELLPAGLKQSGSSQSAGALRPGLPRAGLSRPGPARSAPSQPELARAQPPVQLAVQPYRPEEQVEDGLSVIVRELDEKIHDMIGMHSFFQCCWQFR